jgi:hypothetical protein
MSNWKFFLYCALPSRFISTIGAFELAIQMHMLCNWDNAKLGPSPELWRAKTQESEQVLIWLYNLNSKFLNYPSKKKYLFTVFNKEQHIVLGVVLSVKSVKCTSVVQFLDLKRIFASNSNSFKILTKNLGLAFWLFFQFDCTSSSILRRDFPNPSFSMF